MNHSLRYACFFLIFALVQNAYGTDAESLIPTSFPKNAFFDFESQILSLDPELPWFCHMAKRLNESEFTYHIENYFSSHKEASVEDLWNLSSTLINSTLRDMGVNATVFGGFLAAQFACHIGINMLPPHLRWLADGLSAVEYWGSIGFMFHYCKSNLPVDKWLERAR